MPLDKDASDASRSPAPLAQRQPCALSSGLGDNSPLGRPTAHSRTASDTAAVALMAPPRAAPQSSHALSDPEADRRSPQLVYGDSEVSRSTSPVDLLPETRFQYTLVDFDDENDDSSVQKLKLSSSHSNSIAPYPSERLRCLMAFVLLFVAGLSNDMVLAFIHERVPNTPPLPDLIFAHTPYLPFALTVSELCIFANVGSAFVVCILARHRYTLFKRLWIVSALLYGGRALSMLVTQVPVADVKYHCAPKLNDTSLLTITSRALSLVSGLGLSVGGKHILCGDYIYSGHTVVLVHSYLVVRHYSPKRWWPAHWCSTFVAALGVFCLLLSRGHYTVDVLIAYWLTTRIFWVYHTMCNIPDLREPSSGNMLSHQCWFRLFRWMEDGVPYNVPRRYEWPLPWPRCLDT